VGRFSNKQRDELMLQLGRLEGMKRNLPDESDDAAWERPQVRSLCAQIHGQAGLCLVLLDQLEAAAPRRIRQQLAEGYESERQALNMDLVIFRGLSTQQPGD